MKYLLPALLASALILPAAAFADEAMQDHAAIHQTHRVIHHEKRAEHRAIRHGNLHRAARVHHRIETHKAALHEEHHEMQDRTGE
ncbi:MAG: hypothetical protein WBD92_08645 [Methylovirgula sp.]